jgi:1-acyl-sn-glycerol-3-phosphate acyltransferase
MDGRVLGLDQLPEGHCVVVANHASYLDGVILQAFLPPRFAYVIKSEMKKVPLAHFLLRRIGSRFVERFHTAGSARDARNLLRAADQGQSLAFFPEGTFILEAGLGKFRPGAFATAIKAEAPLVPVVISGSRSILPMGRFLPARGALSVQILDPVMPDHPAFARHRLLAQEARQRMLQVLDEPDLVAASREQ